MTEGHSLADIRADLVDLSEAARLLKISLRTAKRWATDGDFPGDAARKEGRRWVVSVRRLERYYHGDAA